MSRTSISSSLAVCLGVFASAAAAQTVQSTWKANTTLVVQLGLQKATAPVNTDLSNGLLLQRVSTGPYVARFTATQRKLAGGEICFGIQERGIAFFQLSASAGPHETLIRLTSPQPVQGRIRIHLDAAQTGFGIVSGLYRVDVGNDNSWELTASIPAQRTLIIPVKVDAAGLAIKTSTMGTAIAPNVFSIPGFRGDLTITWCPKPRCALSYGTGCGPVLTGAVSSASGGADIALRLSNAKPQAITARLIGVTRLNAMFPGTACFLLTDFPILDAFVVDNQGVVASKIFIPSAINFGINVQHVVLFRRSPTVLEITSSNGLSVD